MAYRFLVNNCLGKPLNGNEPYTIAGGGISGLLLGHWLQKRQLPFTIHEKNSVPGGLIQTRDTQWGYLEKAATGFVWSPEMDKMCRDLKLEILPPGHRSGAKYIVKNKKLTKLPVGIVSLANTSLRLMMPRKVSPVTVSEFSDIFFGPAFSENVVDPAMGGIYAANISDLSFPGALPEIAKWQQKYSFLPWAIWKAKKNQTNKGHKGTHSFENGLGQLIAALAKNLGDKLQLNSEFTKNGPSKKPLILTTPAYIASKFFEGHTLQQLLEEIIYIPVISVNVIFSKNGLENINPGFGCVIPRSEGLESLGVLFKHDIFPQQLKNDGVLCLTCILRDNYKGKQHYLMSQPDDTLAAGVLNELDDLFGVKENPLFIEVNKHEKGIPLYSPQHYKSLFVIDQLLKKDFPHIRLFGNYTGQISIRGLCTAAERAVPA